MPSTYTLNNGIELIATGEQSGTWGDTTNVNLALIDTALDGQVTITLASAGSSGSPNALPISDGSASNGRNRLVIFDDGGDLGATAFVQLTPNDAEKIVYIRNNLTGGRAITLFQGTYNASNDYEVPAGTTAVVFFNGGGAGAVAANVFNNAFFDSLRLGGVSVTAILDEDNMASDSATALATQQSIKAYVDAQVGANNELSEVLANGNTSGGNNIQMTTTDEVQFRDTALTISSSVDGQLDIAADVELEIVAPTLDINASTAVTIDTTTMTMTGSVNVVGDLDVDNLNINGNSIISTNTDGNIALTPNGTGEVDISKVDIDGGTIDGTVIGGASAAAISGTTGSFSGNLTVDTNTLFVDAASNNVGIGLTPSTYKLDVLTEGNNGFRVNAGTGGADQSYLGNTAGVPAVGTLTSDPITVITNGTERMRIDSSGLLTNQIGAVFNESGADSDFRVESDTDTHMLFVDASANAVGIGLSNPGVPLHVKGPTNGNVMIVDATGTSANYIFDVRDDGTSVMRVDPSGNLLVGGTTAGNAGTVSINVGNAGATAGGLQMWAGTAQTSFVQFGDESGTAANHYRGYIAYAHASDSMQFGTASTERMRIDSAGTLIHKLAATFNEDGADADFRVESDTNTHMLFVDASANAVGIGTSSPTDGKLVITGASVTTAQGIRLTGDTADARFICESASLGAGILGTFSNHSQLFYTNSTERTRIDASGALVHKLAATFNEDGADADFRVESDTNANAFFVDGAGAGAISFGGSNPFNYAQTTGNGEVGYLLDDGSSYGSLSISNNADRGWSMFYLNKFAYSSGDDARYINWYVNGVSLATVQLNAAGTQVEYNTGSDRRLKENIVDIDDGITRLKQLQPRKYTWVGTDFPAEGFIADEADGVVPEAVKGEAGAVDPQGNPIYQQIEYSRYVPLLTAALKEAIAKIETLEARIAALETA